MKAKDRVAVARPYVERALQDEEVRENVKSAFLAAKDVYNELLGARGATAVAVRAATDEDIRDRLREAVEELRSAAQRVQGKEDHTARNTTLLIVGVMLGLLFNPFTGRQTREWVKDKVFGPEQTFSYDDQSENGGPAASGAAS
jgi:gas vesicle protein